MGSALLAAILADPDDLAARGVYADRLLGAGDPRGEFIQVQCAIASDTQQDEARLAALRTRETKLLAKHKRAWLAPLAAHIKRATFSRGFPEEIEIDAAKLVGGGAKALVRLTPITSLHITGTTAALAPEVAACDLLARVSSLAFSRAKLTARVAEILFAKLRLPRARSISLATNPRLDDGGMLALARAIAGTTALRDLDLDETGLSPRGIEALIEASPRGLTHLALLRNPRLSGGIATLAASPILATVRDLNLFACDLTDADIIALVESPHLGALERLVVHRNRITDRGARALIDATRSFPALAEVWIHDNELSAKTSATFAKRYPSP